jgi:hypothetical protein
MKHTPGTWNECPTCGGEGFDEDGIECPDCWMKELCPQCGNVVEFVEVKKPDDPFRRCARCGWKVS